MKKSFVIILALLAALSSPAVLAGPHDHGPGEQAHAEEDTHTDDDGDHAHEEEHEEGIIHMDSAKIAKAGIQTATVVSAAVSESIRVPGRIVLADDRRAIVSPRAAGIVKEVFKNIGDTVATGEALAVLESPQIAEVSAEYLAATQAENLAKTVFAREEKLWKEKVTAEQDYLQARNAHQEAKIRLNLASQKLRAAGQLPEKAASGSVYTLVSPIAGKIIRRDLTLGASVDSTHQAFEIADTGQLWVEAAVPAAYLASISERQQVTVVDEKNNASGTVVFISPALDAVTRTAKVIVALPNSDGQWRAGSFATVLVASGVTTAGLSVPISAVQKIEGKTIVFVRTDEGFELREVKAGASGDGNVEIQHGLSEGETVASDNAFILKAELGKSEAEHAH